MATVSAGESPQFSMLPAEMRERILADYAANGGSGPPPSISMVLGGKAITGPVFKGDANATSEAVGPLTRTDVSEMIGVKEQPTQQIQVVPQVGALTQAAPARGVPDIAEMLRKYMPQDDSQSRYLALAQGFGRPTQTGTFAETMSNVASAMSEQKQSQDKLRSQYVPLIMQQVAAQQAREEQNAYRLEAAQQAQQAQALLAQQNRQAMATSAVLAQQGRVDLAAQNQKAADERAAAERASREQIAADRLAGATSAEKLAGKAPAGYAWGPTGADGNPTMFPVKGGPADYKLAGALNADTQQLNGSLSSFDRLAVEANQLLNHPGLAGITGLRGILPNVPGTDAADAQARLETLKSQVGFGVLQDLRNNSKTGGALGNVSDAEGKRLEANLAALANAQSLAQFKHSLGTIIKYSEGAKDRVREAFNLKHGEAKQPASAAPPPAAPELPTQDAIAAEIARRKKGS